MRRAGSAWCREKARTALMVADPMCRTLAMTAIWAKETAGVDVKLTYETAAPDVFLDRVTY
jgi:hypothetical protein